MHNAKLYLNLWSKNTTENSHDQFRKFVIVHRLKKCHSIIISFNQWTRWASPSWPTIWLLHQRIFDNRATIHSSWGTAAQSWRLACYLGLEHQGQTNTAVHYSTKAVELYFHFQCLCTLHITFVCIPDRVRHNRVCLPYQQRKTAFVVGLGASTATPRFDQCLRNSFSSALDFRKQKKKCLGTWIIHYAAYGWGVPLSKGETVMFEDWHKTSIEWHSFFFCINHLSTILSFLCFLSYFLGPSLLSTVHNSPLASVVVPQFRQISMKWCCYNDRASGFRN